MQHTQQMQLVGNREYAQTPRKKKNTHKEHNQVSNQCSPMSKKTLFFLGGLHASPIRHSGKKKTNMHH
jgi:hypothetical protein